MQTHPFSVRSHDTGVHAQPLATHMALLRRSFLVTDTEMERSLAVDVEATIAI
jgi:hypothetical protein